MLIGEYSAKLADKNRVALPKKLRIELKGNIYLTRGYENCLLILDEERWKKLIQTIEVKPFLNKSVRETKRFIAGGATELNLDSQARFIISEEQKLYGGIQKEIMFVGILDWIEIWDLQIWQEKVKSLKTHAGEIAERLLV